MASEIIRDGVKYKVSHSYTFDSSGSSEEHEGGEIYEHEVNAIIKSEKDAAELEKFHIELNNEIAETMKPNIPEKSRLNQKTKQRRKMSHA